MTDRYITFTKHLDSDGPQILDHENREVHNIHGAEHDDGL